MEFDWSMQLKKRTLRNIPEISANLFCPFFSALRHCHNFKPYFLACQSIAYALWQPFRSPFTGQLANTYKCQQLKQSASVVWVATAKNSMQISSYSSQPGMYLWQLYACHNLSGMRLIKFRLFLCYYFGLYGCFLAGWDIRVFEKILPCLVVHP